MSLTKVVDLIRDSIKFVLFDAIVWSPRQPTDPTTTNHTIQPTSACTNHSRVDHDRSRSQASICRSQTSICRSQASICRSQTLIYACTCAKPSENTTTSCPISSRWFSAFCEVRIWGEGEWGEGWCTTMCGGMDCLLSVNITFSRKVFCRLIWNIIFIFLSKFENKQISVLYEKRSQ